MSFFGILARANSNLKNNLPHDGGRCLEAASKSFPTTYQSIARISKATKYTVEYALGRLVLIELEDEAYPSIPLAGDSSFTPSFPTGFSYDKIAIAGTDNFDGEHDILRLDGSPKRLLLLDNVNDPNPGSTDDIVEEDSGWCYIAPLNVGGVLLAPARVISHPSFPQREGEGIYTYPYPPDVTLNFAYSPIKKVGGSIKKTISSSVFIPYVDLSSDVVITEIWLGGSNQVSTLSEMYRIFQAYGETEPDPGEALGWEPRDRTSDRYLIHIVDVTLGGPEAEYQEVRDIMSQNGGSYIEAQLRLRFKLASVSISSLPQIVLSGR